MVVGIRMFEIFQCFQSWNMRVNSDYTTIRMSNALWYPDFILAGLCGAEIRGNQQLFYKLIDSNGAVIVRAY